jgi:hypothetical protein
MRIEAAAIGAGKGNVLPLGKEIEMLRDARKSTSLTSHRLGMIAKETPRKLYSHQVLPLMTRLIW